MTAAAPQVTEIERQDDAADRLRTTIALLTICAQAMAAYEPAGGDRELETDAWRGVESLLLQARLDVETLNALVQHSRSWGVNDSRR